MSLPDRHRRDSHGLEPYKLDFARFWARCVSREKQLAWLTARTGQQWDQHMLRQLRMQAAVREEMHAERERIDNDRPLRLRRKITKVGFKAVDAIERGLDQQLYAEEVDLKAVTAAGATLLSHALPKAGDLMAQQTVVNITLSEKAKAVMDGQPITVSYQEVHGKANST